MEVGIKTEKRLMEIRAATPAAPDSKEMIVEGRAIVFNSPTVIYEYDGIQYFETIDSKALDSTDMTDVVFRYNHSSDVMIMARTKRGSLQLVKDISGLNMRATLFDIAPARDLYTLIQGGAITEMSFAFSVEEDSYNVQTHTRTILKIKKLYDVAAVDSGAYSDTSILARSYFEVEAEKGRKAVEAAELRKKLIIQTLL
jgi:HK97 family phage prohead protease